MKHRVKFEIYGKYIQVDITSNSPEEAVRIVKDRLKIISVEKIRDDNQSDFNWIKEMLGL